MKDRQNELLTLIERATGKAAYTGNVAEEGEDVEVDEATAEADLTMTAATILPNDEKDRGGFECFFIDKDGKKRDDWIHEEILAVGDTYEYRLASYRNAKDHGLEHAEDFNPDNPNGFNYMPGGRGGTRIQCDRRLAPEKAKSDAIAVLEASHSLPNSEKA